MYKIILHSSFDIILAFILVIVLFKIRWIRGIIFFRGHDGKTKENNSNLEENFKNSPGPQFQEASDIVYHHFDDPSQVILNAPVNDYLQEHNSKYYHYAVGGKATQSSSSHKVVKEKSAEAPVRTYDFVIGDE